MVETVANLDKNIKDTEALLESFMPNIPRLFQKRMERAEARNREERK